MAIELDETARVFLACATRGFSDSLAAERYTETWISDAVLKHLAESPANEKIVVRSVGGRALADCHQTVTQLHLECASAASSQLQLGS